MRADKINLADLDAALERHLNRGKTPEHEKRKMEEWEIDLNKVVLKNVIARGTFGTVYKGSFEGQDVAGWSFFLSSFDFLCISLSRLYYLSFQLSTLSYFQHYFF